MNLKQLYTPISVGINLNRKIDSSALRELNFIDLVLRNDLRDANAEQKFYEQLKRFVQKGNNVFLVAPYDNHQIPIAISMVFGISRKLPYIVYFDTKNDPNFANPLVCSLESIRWRSEQATELQSAYLR